MPFNQSSSTPPNQTYPRTTSALPNTAYPMEGVSPQLHARNATPDYAMNASPASYFENKLSDYSSSVYPASLDEQSPVRQQPTASGAATPRPVSASNLHETNAGFEGDLSRLVVVSRTMAAEPLVLEERGSEEADNIVVSLENEELWRMFHSVRNEMIVTKSGRRMFPQLQFKVRGLKERVLYAFSVRFEQLDNHRYKYVNGEWMQGGRPEPAPPVKSYAHSSSPNFGDRLMGGLISYSGIKLTNNGGHKKKSGEDDRKEVLVWLNSLHRYVPYLNIHKVDDNQEKLVASYKITVCEFIAVTAYQNDTVTHLKISFNPFAKAFKKGKETAEDKPKKRARALGFDPTVAHPPYSSHGHNVPPMPAWMPFQHLHNHHQVQMAGGGQYGPGAELVCRSGGPQFHHHTHQHVHVAPTLRPTVSINVNHQYLEGCPDHALHPQFPFVQEGPHYPEKSIARKRQKVHAVTGTPVADGELPSQDLSATEGESSYMADTATRPMRTDSNQNPSPDVAHWAAETQAMDPCRARTWSASPYASGGSEGPADDAVYRSVNTSHAQKMYSSVLDSQASTFNDPRSSCPPGSPDLSNPNNISSTAPNLHSNYSTYSPESYANNTSMYHNYEYVYGTQQQISHSQDMYNSQQYTPQQQLGQMTIHPQ